MGRARDPAELRTAYEAQISALQASCESYDQGNQWESLRLATTTFVLVHDGGKRAKSVLTQLGIRDTIQFVATGPGAISGNMLAETPLVMIRVGGAVPEYLPCLDAGPKPDRVLSFRAWWERDYIFESGDKHHKLNRKKLVFALRNQEGGSHYDAELKDPNYIEATHGKTWMYVSADGQEKPLRQVELATMRQVAWELLESLGRSGRL